MKRDFEDIISNLKETINDYKYYVDFEKIYQRVEDCEEELNYLNTLIGSENIEKDFCYLIQENKSILNVIPPLLALRNKQVFILDGILIKYDFENKSMTSEEYCHFMRKSGLFKLLEENKISNLKDYITGLEVGMDTNARKNRGGRQMEELVESYLKEANVNYRKQVSKKQIENLYNLKINEFNHADKFNANKIFDFAVKTENQLYLIETNFYTGNGSKLNETARSFKSLAKDINSIDNVTFIWITDGVGWKTAKNNLKETYESIDNIYTIYDLERKLFSSILK